MSTASGTLDETRSLNTLGNTSVSTNIIISADHTDITSNPLLTYKIAQGQVDISDSRISRTAPGAFSGNIGPDVDTFTAEVVGGGAAGAGSRDDSATGNPPPGGGGGGGAYVAFTYNVTGPSGTSYNGTVGSGGNGDNGSGNNGIQSTFNFGTITQLTAGGGFGGDQATNSPVSTASGGAGGNAAGPGGAILENGRNGGNSNTGNGRGGAAGQSRQASKEIFGMDLVKKPMDFW